MAIKKNHTKTNSTKMSSIEKQFQHFDINSSVEVVEPKQLLDNQKHDIALKDDYYMQLLEIPGKDLPSLSQNEVARTLFNFEVWLSTFSSDFHIEATKLPVNTDPQIQHLQKCLSDLRFEMRNCSPDSRRYQQLLDREQRLILEIFEEETLSKSDKMYNMEFLLWLIADTTSELDDMVYRAKTSGNNDFLPTEISPKKKTQVLSQFYNMNDKL